MGTCDDLNSGADVGDVPARRRMTPLTPPQLAPELHDLGSAPALVLRVYGRGDDPLSVVMEWRDLPSQVTIASAARTLVGIVEQPLLPASTILTTGDARRPGDVRR